MICCSRLSSHWCKTQTWEKLSALLWFQSYPDSLLPLFWEESEQVLAAAWLLTQLLMVIQWAKLTRLWLFCNFGLFLVSRCVCVPCPDVMSRAIWYFNCTNGGYSFSLPLLSSLASFCFSVDFGSCVSESSVHPFLSVFCNPIACFSTFLGLGTSGCALRWVQWARCWEWSLLINFTTLQTIRGLGNLKESLILLVSHFDFLDWVLKRNPGPAWWRSS